MSKFPSKQDLDIMKKKLNNVMASKILSKNADITERIKFSLCEKFVIYKNHYNLTQKELACRIGIDSSLMSKILHYHFEEFSTDRLIRYLSKIYSKIEFEVA